MPKSLNDQPKKKKRKKNKDSRVSKLTLRNQGKNSKKKKAADPAKLENICYIRHQRHEKTGKGEKFRMSALLNAEKIRRPNPLTPEKTVIDVDENLLLAELSKITAYREVKEIQQTTPHGSPYKIAVISPSDPKKLIPMIRVSKGAVSIFVEDDPAYQAIDQTTAIKSLAQSNPLFTSDAYQAVKLPSTTIKEMQATFTLESISKAEKKAHRNQNEVMANPGASKKHTSAQQYADATGLFPADLKFEWVHLLPYALYGEKAQIMENLLCGSKEMNTWMTAIESLLSSLCSLFEKQGISLHATANLIPKTQIGIDLKYIIHTPVAILEFEFNCQETNKSHIAFAKTMRAVIKQITGLAKAQNNDQKNIAPATQNVSHQTSTREKNIFSLFYKTKKILDDAATQSSSNNPLPNENKSLTKK